MYEQILYEVSDPIATITLNRPKALNAWTNRMGAEVRHAIAQAEADSSVVGILLTGAGRGFCAGADLNDLQDISGGGRGEGGGVTDDPAATPGDPEMGENFSGAYTYLMSVRKPILAAINGPVAGMAVPITACCDLRFASEKAVFTVAFSKRGLIAEWGSAWILPRLIGPSRALDMILSSRKVGAEEALQMGLVNRVVPHDELLQTAREYLETLAAEVSPASMQVMKRQVYEGLHEDFGPAEKKSVKLMFESFGRPDFREGVTSFMEKRPPKFPRV